MGNGGRASHGKWRESSAWETEDIALDRQKLEMGRGRWERLKKGRLEKWKNERQRAAQERPGA